MTHPKPAPELEQPLTASDTGISISITVQLPDDERTRAKVGRHVSKFLEQLQQAGARTGLHPTPDEIDQEMAPLREELASTDAPEEIKRQLEQQIERIDRLNSFRRRAQSLFQDRNL